MKNILNKSLLYTPIILGSFLFSSCESFVDLGSPPTQILYDEAFATDASASTVIRGLYVAAVGSITTANMSTMTTFYPGIAADDLQYNGTEASIAEFADNELLNTNGYVSNLWANLYTLIKNTNNAIDGLEASSTLTPSTKSQLIGEAKFLRAYFYFYLVNFYGGVPLSLKNDYAVSETESLGRASVDEVYDQIITDLLDAEEKMSETYITGASPRGRANKYAASALLARVYLYLQDFENAERYATKVLEVSDYALPSTASNFINTSNEVILQLATATYTTFGYNYVTTSTSTPPNYTVPLSVYSTFETSPNIDARRSNWISPKTISTTTYYAVTKYKVNSGTGNEYHVILRLAEQYLIRAEARANLNNLSGAKEDIDAVRTRAELEGVSSSLTQAQTMTAIETERLHEFFGEYGHRWLDLKRTNRATAVLSPIKSGWQSTDVLFPIPNAQILVNVNLTQNPGYDK
ncbi:RagB/SusD family nutrient uptake outer membrane protein [Sphingobacterium sp. LRF_L2]|uniref:RagB/SusD family nutrient uptake outer membrane protein n=1 Tax=Sphingobacterium sp. LRF_L2 TaxID=3369421 RepID=UPI003F5F22A4